MMGVSTQTLRAALAELRHLGLVETRRGRGGGSFVKANTGDIAKARRETLAGYSLEDLRDIREYRAVLAGSAAAAAAARTQQVAVGRLESLGAMVATVHDPADMTRADSRFHMELAAASRSVRLTRQEMALQAEVGPLIWTSSADGGRQAAHDHAAIVDAVRRGDVVLARTRAEEHVRHDMNRLIDLRMSMDTAAPGAPPNVGDEDRIVASVKALARAIVERAVASIRIVEDTVQAGLDAAPDGEPGGLKAVDGAAQAVLSSHVSVLYGLGFLGEASFFGEPVMAWSYIPPGSQMPRRLDMDLQFYDYASAPWWPANEAEDKVHASYAYVDANGSNAYIITFSKKVLRGSRMIGAAESDVLISQLQAQFAPLLDGLPRESCVVDQNDVVIATNSGSLVGGIFDRSGPGGRSIALPEVPWRLEIAEPNAPEKR